MGGAPALSGAERTCGCTPAACGFPAVYAPRHGEHLLRRRGRYGGRGRSLLPRLLSVGRGGFEAAQLLCRAVPPEKRDAGPENRRRTGALRRRRPFRFFKNGAGRGKGKYLCQPLRRRMGAGRGRRSDLCGTAGESPSRTVYASAGRFLPASGWSMPRNGRGTTQRIDAGLRGTDTLAGAWTHKTKNLVIFCKNRRNGSCSYGSTGPADFRM